MAIGLKDSLNQQMMMSNQPGLSDNIGDVFSRMGDQKAVGPAQRSSNAFLSGIGGGLKGSANNRRNEELSPYFEKAGEITAMAAELEAQMMMGEKYKLSMDEFAKTNTPLIAEFASAVDSNDPRAALMFKNLVSKASSTIPGFENLEGESWNPGAGYGLALNTQTGEYRKISADDIVGLIAPYAQQIYGDRWFEKFIPLNGGFAKNAEYDFNKQQYSQNLDIRGKETSIANTASRTNYQDLQGQALQQQMNNPATPELSDIEKFDLKETRKSNENFLKDLQSEVTQKDPETKLKVLNRLEEILTSSKMGIGSTPKAQFERWVKKKFGQDADIQEAKMLQKYFFSDIKGVAGNPNAKEWEDLMTRLISGDGNVEATLNVLNFERQQAQNSLNLAKNFKKAISETQNKIPYYDPRIEEIINNYNNKANQNNISDEELGIKFQ